MVSDVQAIQYSCPNCGAPVAGNARACSYCHVALTTRRCAHCFDHNPASAVHCATCGRELGLERVTEASALCCPACRVPLETLTEAAGTLFDCARCGGHFVEHQLLRALIEQRAEVATTAVPRPQKPASLFADRINYRPCARCNVLMHRKNFGETSGVVVDVCATHGIWFDAGELPAVLSFVERGGLARARAREEERLRKARVEQRTSRGPAFTILEPDERLNQGLLEFIVSLFAVL